MEQNNSEDKIIINDRKVSDILKTLPDDFSTPKVTIGELKTALSVRSYGILLLVLALPNLVPIPAPGLSAILGIPLIFITAQFMLGLKSPWFPEFIARKEIKCDDMKKIFTRIIPYIEKLEFITKPRLKFLVRPPTDRFIALICFVLSLVITMAVPFGNALPALAICFFALGILQRDGLFTIFGIIMTILSIAVISVFLNWLYLAALKIFGF
jgi:hypothetical protein